MAAAAILIVDDEPANMRLLQQMLAVDGYRNVIGITDPRETLARVVEQGTDLLLLDLNMPHMDGFQVMEQLKVMDQAPAILALTAQATTDYRLRPLRAGARDIAITHHEKWDGSGYPDGRRGEEIPLVGRIVAVADVFDALTSARPYKPAWSVERALEYLSAQRGLHFEPRLVDIFPGHLDAFLSIRERYAELEDQSVSA